MILYGHGLKGETETDDSLNMAHSLKVCQKKVKNTTFRVLLTYFLDKKFLT